MLGAPEENFFVAVKRRKSNLGEDRKGVEKKETNCNCEWPSNDRSAGEGTNDLERPTDA